MPPINKYKCNKCGFALPSGWGGYMYVEDDRKKRIVCPHPVEYSTVTDVLGANAPMDLIKARTGFNSYCLCLNCLHQFEADLGDEQANPWRRYYGALRQKDDRKCPRCKSTNIKTVFELIGTPCPKCKNGLIEEIETGIIS